MPVSNDMAAMWRRPADVVRGHLSAGRREDRVLAYLLGGCLLVFVGRLPILQRAAVLAGEEGDFLRDASYAFLTLMMIAPLIFYGIAALGGLAARAFGARPSGYGARLAMFWAYLSAAPVALLYGLALGLAGPGPAVTLVGALWVAAFLSFWIIGLRVAGQETAHA